MKKLTLIAMVSLLALGAMAQNTQTATYRIDDMHCRKCSDRIQKSLSQVAGVDTVVPRIGKHTVAVTYQTAKTSRDAIRQTITEAGYTPCNYLQGSEGGYAYLLLPAEQATLQTEKTVMLIDGVADVNVNARRKAMAVTYHADRLTADQLLAAIQAMGINAQLPKPHVCSEEEEKK